MVIVCESDPLLIFILPTRDLPELFLSIPSKPVEGYAKYAGNGVYVMIQRALAPAEVSEDELKEIRNDFFDIYKEFI